MNNDTRAMLLESGINPKHKAFAYLGALAEMIEVFPLKRVGYPAVAEMFGTDERSVDKAIQNAIAAAWTKRANARLYREFGDIVYERKGKPTSARFIAKLCAKASENRR